MSHEVNKRLSFHNGPWQLVPIQHCSWQKGVFEAVYISLVCDVLLAVTSSGLSGLGDWVVFGGDLHEAVFHFVGESNPIVVPSLLQSLPSQVIKHGRERGNFCIFWRIWVFFFAFHEFVAILVQFLKFFMCTIMFSPILIPLYKI